MTHPQEAVDAVARALARESEEDWAFRLRHPQYYPKTEAYRAEATALLDQIAPMLVAAAEAEARALTAGRDEAEAEELRVALGAGGTGRGTAGALRGSAGALKDLEKRQKSRQTRASRDALDRALIDLATYFRDALMVASGAGAVAPSHPDMTDRVAALAAHGSRDRLLRSIEAVLACREALAANVKPKFAIDAMVATVGQALRSGE